MAFKYIHKCILNTIKHNLIFTLYVYTKVTTIINNWEWYIIDKIIE